MGSRITYEKRSIFLMGRSSFILCRSSTVRRMMQEACVDMFVSIYVCSDRCLYKCPIQKRVQVQYPFKRPEEARLEQRINECRFGIPLWKITQQTSCLLKEKKKIYVGKTVTHPIMLSSFLSILIGMGLLKLPSIV